MAAAVAGPALIVIAVIIVLRDFLFEGRITSLNGDIQAAFMLNHCFLGESLAAGEMPGWHPNVMLGTPFLADAQAGWMYLPAMLLYTLFPCDVAIRLFIVLQPVLAGLALYWFLRQEDLSRAAATVGGLVLAVVMSSSKIAINIPFPDSLAWSAILLAVGARYLRAETWSGRIAWGVAVAAAWGQLAAAHLSHGFLMGTGAFLFYAVVRTRTDVTEGRISWKRAGASAALLIVLFAGVNLAHLLPVAEYTPRSNFGLGYTGMSETAARLQGLAPPRPVIFRAAEPIWILRLATAPGAYFGAASLLLAAAGLWVRKTRALTIAFGLYVALMYLLGLRSVVTGVTSALGEGMVSDFYTHSPGRFVYGAIFGLTILAALGVEAWREAPTLRTRVAMVAPGALLWGAGPIVAGAYPSRLALFGLGALAAAGLGFWSTRRVAAMAVLPALLAVELVAGAILGQLYPDLAKSGLETPGTEWMPLKRLPLPAIDAASYVKGSRAERAASMGEGRVITLGAGLIPALRPAYSDLEMAQGYNPLQVRRYWTYFRALEEGQPRYNKSIFTAMPGPVPVSLMNIEWVFVKGGTIAPPDEERVLESDTDVYRLDAGTRASLHPWTVVGGSSEALAAVTSDGFDPDGAVILETDPSLGPARTKAVRGSADIIERTSQRIELDVESPAPAVLLVRQAFDEHWRASVDGRDTPVLAADYFLQGVPLPPGEHEVVLRYDNPWIGYGLAGSGATLVAALGAWLVTRRRTRRLVESR